MLANKLDQMSCMDYYCKNKIITYYPRDVMYTYIKSKNNKLGSCKGHIHVPHMCSRARHCINIIDI
jgi:hypothetical protein